MRQNVVTPSDSEFFGTEENWGYGPVLEIFSRFCGNPSARSILEMLVRTGALRGPYANTRDLVAERTDPNGIRENVVSVGVLVLEVGALGIKIFLERFPERTELRLWIPPRHVELVCPGYPWNRNVAWIDTTVLSLFGSVIGFIRKIHGLLPLKRAIVEDEAYMVNPADDVDGIVISEDFANPPAHFGARKHDGFAVVCLNPD